MCPVGCACAEMLVLVAVFVYLFVEVAVRSRSAQTWSKAGSLQPWPPPGTAAAKQQHNAGVSVLFSFACVFLRCFLLPSVQTLPFGGFAHPD